jgi:hypothetical protein
MCRDQSAARSKLRLVLLGTVRRFVLKLLDGVQLAHVAKNYLT